MLRTKRLSAAALLCASLVFVILASLFGPPLARADPTGAWAATGGMAVPRVLHTATLLGNGKVLVAGGYNSGFLATAELYDSTTGTWAPTGDMAVVVEFGHTATLLGNGKVLVAGGVGGGILATAEVYTPAGTAATTSLAVSAATGVTGGTTTLSANVTANGSGVSGETITFTLNGQPFPNNTATTDGSGNATVTNVSLAGLSAGTLASGVGASFAGDTNYQASSGTGSLTVGRADTGTTTGDISATFGLASVSLAAQVAAQSPSTAPVNEGSITWTLAQNGATIATVGPDSVSNGMANGSLPLSGLNAGTLTLLACYSDSAGVNFNNSCGGNGSGPASFSLGQASQTISFGTLSARTFGDSPFNISATASSGLPVSFAAAGNCTIAATANSDGSYAVTLTAAGSCTITAAQAGNGNFTAAPSVAQGFTISAPQPVATVLAAAAASGVAGGTTTLSATLTANGAGVSGKTITFTLNGQGFPNNTATTDGSGKATLTNASLGSLGAGTLASGIGASFAGDASDAASNGSASLTITPAVPTDTTAPSCALTGTGVDASGRKYIQITVQDAGSGLGAIAVTESVNASTPVPSFTAGTTSPVVVTATKLDQSQGAAVALQVTDVAGNVTTCDPVLTDAVRADGMPVSQTVGGVQQADNKATVVNVGGVDNLTITINGKDFQVNALKAGQQASIDLSAALKAGANQVSITVQGQPGSSAMVLFGNI